MNKFLVLGILIISPNVWADSINVLSSFSILGDMTKELGGDRIKVTTLIGANQDAHTYQLQSQDIKKIQSAKLIIMNGLDFERADIRRAVQNSGKKFVNATTGINALPVAAHDHHSEHHDHGVYDPHVWHDPVLMQTYTRNITNALISVDPQGKQYYLNRLKDYQSKLNQLHIWSQNQFQTVPAAKRKAMTAHHSFAYLGKRYQIKFYSPQGVSTHDAASASTIASLIKHIKKEQIKALLIENMVNPKIVQQISKETKVNTKGTLYTDALSTSGAGKTYLSLMRHNVVTLTNAMKN